MKSLTIEWIQKAEDDFFVAQAMYRSRKHPVYDAVCFHSQQCAEKYLKAFLQEHDVDIPKTHKLLDLLRLCKENDPALEMLISDLIILDRFAVQVRYPGTTADKEDAKATLTALTSVRAMIRSQLAAV
jgi:HEPN domain-containing protein